MHNVKVTRTVKFDISPITIEILKEASEENMMRYLYGILDLTERECEVFIKWMNHYADHAVTETHVCTYTEGYNDDVYVLHMTIENAPKIEDMPTRQ